MFNHRSIQPTIFLFLVNSDFQYLLLLCTDPVHTQTQPCLGNAARMPLEGCGHRNFPVSVSHPSFLKASFFFLLSLTSASGCFLLTFHGGGPESIRIHFSGFLARCHRDGPTEKSGDDGYTPACWYRFLYRSGKSYIQMVHFYPKNHLLKVQTVTK